MKRISIIINNRNYEEFIRDAIRSALEVRWDNKEIIVVDDGSSDNSREVVSSFGSQIVSIFKENGGQNSAANEGFARSTGDIIIFLDSDDMLFTSVAEEVCRGWYEGIAKVQYGLMDIDGSGRPLGHQHWLFSARHTPDSVLNMLRRRGSYLAPVTSGNAWSRRFLQQVFPLPVRQPEADPPAGVYYGRFFDHYLHILAPFFGDVVSLTSPQGYYRVHDRNETGARRISPTYALNHYLDVGRTMAKATEVLSKRGKSPGFPIEWERDEFCMHYRLIAQKLIPERCPPPGLPGVFLKYCRSVWLSEHDPVHKSLYLTWAILTLLAPASLARWAFQMRTSPGARPNFLKGIMRVQRASE